eukprot:1968433-Prymnesium_polylepis.3
MVLALFELPVVWPAPTRAPDRPLRLSDPPLACRRTGHGVLRADCLMADLLCVLGPLRASWPSWVAPGCGSALRRTALPLALAAGAWGWAVGGVARRPVRRAVAPTAVITYIRRIARSFGRRVPALVLPLSRPAAAHRPIARPVWAGRRDEARSGSRTSVRSCRSRRLVIRRKKSVPDDDRRRTYLRRCMCIMLGLSQGYIRCTQKCPMNEPPASRLHPPPQTTTHPDPPWYG